MRTFAVVPLVVLTCLAGMTACGKDVVNSSSAPPPTARNGAPVASAAVVVASKGPDLSENDFAENDHNRDPFRSFASLFVDKTNRSVKNELPVILPQYAIDELKLVAIVLAGDYPRAMVLDPTGKGWVVKRGDYIGRPDTVHTGGTNGTDYQLNWRVDRVRDGEIVLSREDRAQISAPATRIIPLHPDTDKDSEREQRL
jgi:type IV pilus assembly protein PilP